MTHGSLFSGIGGFDLAAEWMGWQNIFQVEIEEYCQRLLAQNFPNVERHRDIREFDGKQYAGRIDIISGGFPCQPFSQAGKRQGKEDPRHLWPQMLRIISEIEPRWVLGENVSGIFSWSGGLVFDEIQSDLADIGYETIPVRIPAVAVGAPHRRDRWWFIAHSKSARKFGRVGDVREEERGPRGTLLRRTHGAGDGHATDTTGVGIGGTRGLQRSGEGERENPKGASDHSQQSGDATADTGREHGTRTQNSGELERQTGSRDASESQRSTGRDTVRSIAYTENIGQQFGKQEPKARKNTTTRTDRSQWERSWIEVAAEFCTVDDGLPVELDGFTLSKSKHREHQLKGLGNAIVPQVAYEIFKAIEETDKHEV